MRSVDTEESMLRSHTYSSLGQDGFLASAPTPVREPKLLLWNDSLAESLGVNALIREEIENDRSLTEQDLREKFFSGNQSLPNFEPISLAYSGHQFGHYSPLLGDGRAHLVGVFEDESGEVFDVQLKGSGPTRFSRRGDGRCGLKPAVREYLMSEALYALGVPTSRSLSVVSTGEEVFRYGPEPGGIVARVSISHLRVGTFQLFASRRDVKALEGLVRYACERHYPDIEGEIQDVSLALLNAVIDNQVKLITNWMRIGFIHGVMNTDNVSIPGITIDYGPCAMLGIYDPKTTYSSIDTARRYAFGNQPNIMQWNMARFAECLIDLLNDDQDKAIEIATEAIQGIAEKFQSAWAQMMARKIGANSVTDEGRTLVRELLENMKDERLDYTQTFYKLTKFATNDVTLDSLKNEFDVAWLERWQKLISDNDDGMAQAAQLMTEANPVVIPRNHHVERVLSDIETTRDPSSCEDFLKVLRTPYTETKETAAYQDLPADGDCNYQTFCGT